MTNCSDVEVPNVELTATKTLKLRPLGDRILVKVIKINEDELVNGLVRPGVAIEKPSQGVVVAVGNGRTVNGERIAIDVKVDDIIIFGKYSGNDCEVMGRKLILLQEDEVQGVYYAE